MAVSSGHAQSQSSYDCGGNDWFVTARKSSLEMASVLDFPSVTNLCKYGPVCLGCEVLSS
jgi:hypothetical protein